MSEAPRNAITGVILAGGNSTRMGRNKALLHLHGKPLIKQVHDVLGKLFTQTLLITNTPETYSFLPCPAYPDLFVGEGSLAGIHAALHHAPTELIFVAACDMPFISPSVVSHLCGLAEGYDIVVPCSPYGMEPLHALYRRSCLPVAEQLLRSGRKRIFELFDLVQTRRVAWPELAALDGAAQTFLNINTPEEFEAL